MSTFGEVCEQRKVRGGRKKFVEIISYPVRTNGDVEYVAEIIKDVTESVLKEKEKVTLAAIEEMLRSVVEKEVPFERITAALVKDFDYEACIIGVLREEGEKIAIVSCSVNQRIGEQAKTMAVEYLDRAKVYEGVLIEGGLLERVVMEKKPLITENVHELVMDHVPNENTKRLVSMLIKDAALKYGLLVPVAVGNRVAGIIGVASADELGNDAIRVARFSRIAGQRL